MATVCVFTATILYANASWATYQGSVSSCNIFTICKICFYFYCDFLQMLLGLINYQGSMSSRNILFLWITQVHTQTLNTHARSPLWIHVRKPYPYEHLRKTVPAHLETDEVTTGASLSTGTSPTTESTMPLNPRINPGKCEHPCQVEDLNPDE